MKSTRPKNAQLERLNLAIACNKTVVVQICVFRSLIFCIGMHEIRLGQAMLCTACQLGDTIKAHTPYKQYKAAWQLSCSLGKYLLAYLVCIYLGKSVAVKLNVLQSTHYIIVFLLAINSHFLFSITYNPLCPC